MATAFLSTPPAPPPSVTCPDSHVLPPNCLLQLCHKQSRIWVELLLLSGVFLSLFTHLAHGRRYTSRTWTFRYPLWAAYLTIASVVSYTLGMMSNQPPALHSDLYFAWGIMFVVIAYELSGTISAFSLDDNENGMKMLLEQAMLTVYIFGVFPPPGDDNRHSFNEWRGSLVATFVWSIIVYGETAYARMIASLSSKGAAYWVGAEIASHMEMEHQRPDNDSMDPSSMVGYRYFVDVMKGSKVTIEDIWSCQGKVLCTGNRRKDDRRKDLCLSFAFFWLLLRRYGGYPLHEACQDKTWRLVSENLLPDDGGEPERAFKVIELELHFLYDFFYTKHCAVYAMGPLRLVNHFFLIFTYITLTLQIMEIHALEEDTGAVQFLGINLDITVTWVLLGTFVILYILQGFVNATSIWARVRLMCYYVQKNLFNNRFLEKLLEMILRIDWAMRCPNWERKLGQYSFLDSYFYKPWYGSARNDSFMLFSLPRNGQREEKRINLSKEVKEAIGRSIKKNGHKLSDGVQALRRHRFNEERLSQIYPSNSIAEHILTWHIATSWAAKDRGARPSGEDWNEYDVAVSLSNYCAYLVVFAPELLPDHRRSTELFYDSMIENASKIRKRCGCDIDRNRIFREVESTSASTLDGGTLALRNSALLADELIHGHSNSGQRWKMLAEFWADLLVYLAPSDNAKAHAEHLATGGEFITHIWALLTHAGIITRDNAENDTAAVSREPSMA